MLSARCAGGRHPSRIATFVPYCTFIASVLHPRSVAGDPRTCEADETDELEVERLVVYRVERVGEG